MEQTRATLKTKKTNGASSLLALAGRNLKLFFRDRASVFFSLMAVLIVFGLYALFLGATITRGMENVEGIDFLMNSWVIAGIMAVISMTSTLGAFGVMVEDRARKMYKDFSVSPLRRSTISGGYVLSAFCVGVIMSLVALLVGEIYIVASGGELLPASLLLPMLGAILLSVLSSSAIVFFIVSFFKSTNAFATASTVIGTLIGFLTGMYIPIGILPAGVQTVMKAFPVSYSASLFRNIFMERPMEIAFADAPQTVVTEFKTELGVHFQYGEETSTIALCIAVLVVTAVVFYALALLNISRKRKV